MSDIVSGERVRWLTYAEAGRLLGAKADSVRRRAMRSEWRRQQGNDGRTLVAVPLDVLEDVTGDKSAPSASPDIRGDVADSLSGERAALRSSLARLEAERPELLKVTLQAQQEAQEARALAERRGEEVAELREKLARQEALQPLVERLQADRDAVITELASVYQEAQEARQTASRQAVELAEVRERAGRAKGERDRADQRAAELAQERDQVAHQVAEVRAELAAWREGGPIARAVRAFLWRRLLL